MTPPSQNENAKENENENENLISHLELTRKAQMISLEKMAARLKVSKSTYCKYETNEKLQKITLASLKHAAHAMDCELIYALRPKIRKTFSQQLWNKLLLQILKDQYLQNCNQKRSALALVYLAKKLGSKRDVRQILDQQSDFTSIT